MTPSEAGLEIARGENFVKLRQWLNLNTDNGEPLIYALLECMQDRLDRSDLSPVDKGELLNDIFQSLSDNNKEDLAFYRAYRNACLDSATATKH